MTRSRIPCISDVYGGLKIRWGAIPVWVRVPLLVGAEALINQGFGRLLINNAKVIEKHQTEQKSTESSYFKMIAR